MNNRGQHINNFIIIPGFVMFVVLIWQPMKALALTGTCSNCHVMHASKEGTTNTPNDRLLLANCLGCHTGSNSSGSIPYVYTAGVAEANFTTKNAAGTTLAGGNFGFLADGDHKGHNIDEMAAINAAYGDDADHTGNPPGWTTGYTDNINGDQADNGADSWGNNLSCAGTYGCHGDHSQSDTMTAIDGTHHGNTSGAVAANTIATSFRFLAGIDGYEDDDYEFEVTTDHNLYLGESRATSSSSTAEAAGDDISSKQTMSFFCAMCHGKFHSGTASNDGISDSGDTMFNDPWIRHPNDVTMPNAGEFAAYAYSWAVPVATSDVDTDDTIDVSSDSDRIVMCLSCHVAHASPYDYALRWDPSTMVLGSVAAAGTGCFACHSTKDG